MGKGSGRGRGCIRRSAALCIVLLAILPPANLRGESPFQGLDEAVDGMPSPPAVPWDPGAPRDRGRDASQTRPGNADDRFGEIRDQMFPPYREPGTGMVFLHVPGGCYDMGDRGRLDAWADNEKPVHRVCVDDFYLGKFEVTQDQWRWVMDGENPSAFPLCASCPVENVSREEVTRFLKRLGSSGPRTYRLPTEAEWEYAARSGGTSHTWAGTVLEAELGEYAWYERNSRSRTHPAGQKWANRLGFHDMSGNVWEMCSDLYDPAYYWNSPQSNPTGPEKGRSWVIRGGDWSANADDIRTSVRNHTSNPANKRSSIGFRVAFTP